MLLKCCSQYSSKFGKLSSAHRTKRDQMSIPRKGIAEEYSKYRINVLLSHASKVMLKNPSSQISTVYEIRTSRCSSWIQKSRGNRDQIANICWIIEKASKLKKKSSSASLTMLKALNVWIRTNYRKFLKVWEYSLDCITCLLRSLYAGQEASQYQTWNSGMIKNWEGIHRGCILSPCLFNIYTEYIT